MEKVCIMIQLQNQHVQSTKAQVYLSQEPNKLQLSDTSSFCQKTETGGRGTTSVATPLDLTLWDGKPVTNDSVPADHRDKSTQNPLQWTKARHYNPTSNHRSVTYLQVHSESTTTHMLWSTTMIQKGEKVVKLSIQSQRRKQTYIHIYTKR